MVGTSPKVCLASGLPQYHHRDSILIPLTVIIVIAVCIANLSLHICCHRYCIVTAILVSLCIIVVVFISISEPILSVADNLTRLRQLPCERPMRIVTILFILLPFFLSLSPLRSEQWESLSFLKLFSLSFLFSILTLSNSSLAWSFSLALVARPVLWYEQCWSYPSFLTELVEMTVERERERETERERERECGSFHF